MRRLFFLSTLLTITVLCDLMAQGESRLPFTAHPATVTVGSSDNNRILLQVQNLTPLLEKDGSLAHNAMRQLYRYNAESLPELRFQLAVPFDAENLRASVETIATNQAPVGDMEIAPSSQSRPAYEIVAESRIRSLRTVTVAWRPFTLQNGELQWASRAEIRLEWDRAGDSEKGGRKVINELPAVKEQLRRLVLNYDQIATLPTFSGVSDRTVLSAAPDDWGIGQPAMVLLVPETGIYSLRASDFIAARGPATLSIDDLRLTNRGEPVRFFFYDNGAKGQFDGSDIIEFRGDRNPGEPGIYLNEITDTNAYILTWSGGAGEGPEVVEPRAKEYDQVIETYDSTLHIEKEKFWFGGMALPQYLDGEVRTLHTSERVQHERFYWSKTRLTIEKPLEFECNPVYGPGLQTKMNVRVAGVTYWADDPDSPDQVMEFFLNDVSLGTASIRDTADAVVSFTFPSNYLVNGTNKMVVRIQQHASPIINEVNVDYIELTGRWIAKPEGRTLILPSVNTPNTGMVISGFPDKEIETIIGDSIYRSALEERGHLFQLSSRGGASLRRYPGFYAKVGDEQVNANAPDQLGVVIMEVDRTGQRILRQQHFNTAQSADAYDQAIQFINEVQNNNIVLAGLAFGLVRDPYEPFIAAFEGLGSKAVREQNMFVGSWVFAARKGNPSSAIEEFVQDDQGVTKNIFFPDANNGRVWRATVPVSSEAGEEGISASLRSPLLRYHDGDKLLDPGNRADLIIITHPAFASEAERLAAHRRSNDNLEVRVVDIHRIYDEFNHGVKDQIAIRRFLQFADSNWAAPQPAFVILFGDASWDSQQRMDESIMIDYIPSSGVPSTDQKYVVAIGDTTLTPRQFIGRLPATSLTDARAMVDKLVEYDALPPAEWNKRFVFATGGNSVGERDELEYAAFTLADVVTGPPLYGEATVISRSEQTTAELQLPSTVDGPRVRQAVNRGALSLDFNGHGATTTLDLNFGFPEDFDNGHRYFFLSTWSCQTGLFSHPSLTLRNERFVTIPGKGTIASIGGTSFSFVHIDYDIRHNMYSKLADPEGELQLGVIFSLSKYEMYANRGFGWYDEFTYDPKPRTHMLMYNFLGDPSMRVAIRRTPELAIPAESATLYNEENREPQLGDSTFNIRAAVWNFGAPLSSLQIDSGVVVRATVIDPQGSSIDVEQKVDSLFRYDSVTFTLPIGTIPGEYVVSLEVDPDRTVEESYYEDNELIISFLLRGSQPLPLEPLPYGVVEGYDDITIRLLNPASGPGAEFVLDTVPTFDSPGRISSVNQGTVDERELTTSWTFSIPSNLRSSRKFWWRGKATSGDPDLAERFPLVESFTVQPSQVPEVVEVGGVNQMATTRLVNLVNDVNGVGPGTRAVPLYIYAVGQARSTDDPDGVELPGKPLTIRVGNQIDVAEDRYVRCIDRHIT